jgi:pyruvate kinase
MNYLSADGAPMRGSPERMVIMDSQQRPYVAKVKIVATLGPASSGRETVRAMLAAGVDVVRLNFSHGAHPDHERTFGIVREEAARLKRHVAVLGDLSGPKIRTGTMENGAIPLREGAAITITTEPCTGSSRRISTTYPGLPGDVSPGDFILLDDGRLKLTVEKVSGGTIRCRVVQGGTLRDHKGMNMPGTALSVSAVTEKDKRDIEFARRLQVDYLALSFVRRAADLRVAQQLAGDIPVIAKIKKPEAVANLGEIIDAAQGIMVARGDLGVEAGPEKVPLLQKRIIRDATAAGLPVIVATQMMESMITEPEPTRAEVSDVANAVLDGTDAVMLSGETAVGRYPVETVERMASVIREVESSDHLPAVWPAASYEEGLFSRAIARAVVTVSQDFGLSAIGVYSESGRSASLVSANRPRATIAAFCRHPEVLRRLALRWGVVPIESAWQESSDDMVALARHILSERSFALSGERVAVAFGLHAQDGTLQTDTLKLIEMD